MGIRSNSFPSGWKIRISQALQARQQERFPVRAAAALDHEAAQCGQKALVLDRFADCGGKMCTIANAKLAAAAPPCCMMDGTTCGMMSPLGMCLAVYEDPGGHMCPDAMVLTTMVPGCCADGTKCGVVDLLTGSGCYERSMVPLAPLPPINCDGTMPMGTPDAGM